MNKLYDQVLDFEASLGIRFDFVLHVGDFGIWPDPTRIDKGTRNHDGAGDFPAWLEATRTAPRRTVFIKGNHEDFRWLDAQPSADVLPNLTCLPNGETIDLTVDGTESIRVGGIGGSTGLLTTSSLTSVQGKAVRRAVVRNYSYRIRPVCHKAHS